MIEARVMPVSRVVTTLTLLTTTAVMCVIGLVAAKTVSRRVREGAVLVTIQTCRLLMLAEQRKFCDVVVKLGFDPFGRLMARSTVIVHRILVRLVIAVTVDAVRRRFTMFLVGGVAVAALGFEVCAYDLEVGDRVVEVLFNQNYDIGVTAFMIRMTGRTLCGARVWMQAVIAT